MSDDVMMLGAMGPGFAVRGKRSGRSSVGTATVGGMHGVDHHDSTHAAGGAGGEETHQERLVRTEINKDDAHIGLSADEGLRNVAWNGLPAQYRATVWTLLVEYTPRTRSRRERELSRKRAQYMDYVASYFRDDAEAVANMMPQEKEIMHQLSIDLPRHKMAIFHIPHLVKRLERLLFIWSLRHPAVGYVQGMDDITVVFYLVFLAEHLPRNSIELASSKNVEDLAKHINALSAEQLDQVEADTYWCAGKMLSWVQDHFVVNQPRVHKLMKDLRTLMERVDEDFVAEMDDHGIEFIQFAFQWIHCLLVREIPIHLSARLWDTYLSIGSSFADFHVFVCAALMQELKKHASGKPMDVFLHTLQNPGSNFTLDDGWIDMLIAQAYYLRLKFPPK